MQLEIDFGGTKRCTKCKETKDTVEFCKDNSKKDGLFNWCRSCWSANRRKRIPRYASTPTPTTQQCSKCKETKVAGEFNKDSFRIGGLASLCKVCRSVHFRRWRLTNDGHARHLANKARHRAFKLRATPSWEDKRKTLLHYEEARQLTKDTGEVHHVDHLVPLNHWSVRGLHWHINLKVVPGVENMSKGNRFWSGDGWSDWSDYYWEFEEEFVQLKEYAKWLKSLTSPARSAHLAMLTTSTQLQAKATATRADTGTETSVNERNEKICQASA